MRPEPGRLTIAQRARRAFQTARRWPSRRREARRRRRLSREYTPLRLLPVWLVLPVALAAAAAAAWIINDWIRSRPDLVGTDPNPLEVSRIVLSLVAGVGAVFVGVYAYRKQRLEEKASDRAEHDQFLARYNAAAEQLAHDKPAAHLAGVYALARLADDWPTRRQSCVDVLCAYLRMSSGKDDLREVCSSILQVVADHLKLEGHRSWSSLDLNFRGVRFIDAVFSEAWFGGDTDFSEATFTGAADFSEAHFSCPVSFARAQFEGPSVSFEGATFGMPGIASRFGPWANFSDAEFSGTQTNFRRVYATAPMNFSGATFGAISTDFDRARFDSHVFFTRAFFTWGRVSFTDAVLGWGAASFEGAGGLAKVSGLDEQHLWDGARAAEDSAPE